MKHVEEDSILKEITETIFVGIKTSSKIINLYQIIYSYYAKIGHINVKSVSKASIETMKD